MLFNNEVINHLVYVKVVPENVSRNNYNIYDKNKCIYN